jgi:hypothetical protein
MRNAFKHTGVLMMVAVVGLALAGAAYALWFEDLTLTASVSTGTFNVDWSCDDAGHSTSLPSDHDPLTIGDNAPIDCSSSADPVVYLGGTFTTTTEPVSPLVGEGTAAGQIPTGKAPTCGASLTTNNATGVANDSGDYNALTLTAGNLYPYTACRYYIDIHNFGSVPAHLRAGAVSCASGTICAAVQAGILSVSVTDADCFGTCSTSNPTLDANAAAACAALFNSGDGTEHEISYTGGDDSNHALQLHTSNHLGCTIEIRLNEVINGDGDVAPEGASYTETFTIQAHQWNESGDFTP